MRPCASTDPTVQQLHHAALAGTDDPPPEPVTAYQRPQLGGELSGGAYAPYPSPGGTPPPAPEAARPPQRPAVAPQGRRISLSRFVAAFPLQLGHHGDIERVLSRPAGEQLRVERRGATYRAAPDITDPAWAEVAS